METVFTRVANLKRKLRAAKQKYIMVNRIHAMPKIRTVHINANYINPVTLGAPPTGLVVYRVRDPVTRRVDYYDKATFWRLVGKSAKNNWNLFVNRKRRLFVNPVTRAVIQSKNVERVMVRRKPSRSAAAAKIKSALRKRVAARKAASPKKKNNSRKSH